MHVAPRISLPEVRDAGGDGPIIGGTRVRGARHAHHVMEYSTGRTSRDVRPVPASGCVVRCDYFDEAIRSFQSDAYCFFSASIFGASL